MIEGRSAEEAEKASTFLHSRGRSPMECLAPIDSVLSVHADVLAAELVVDRGPVGVGQVGVAGNGVLPLMLQILGLGLDAVAGTDHDVETRIQSRSPSFLDD